MYRRPGWWIAAIPLLLLPCCWLWWGASSLNPGVAIGRSAQVLLMASALLVLLRRPGDAWPPAVIPLFLALAWQSLSLSWCDLPEQGLLAVMTRATACAAAIGLTAWLTRQPEPNLPAFIGVAGLMLLAMTTTPFALVAPLLRLGVDAPLGNPNLNVHVSFPLMCCGLAFLLATAPRRGLLMAAAALPISLFLFMGWAASSSCRSIGPLAVTAVCAVLVLRLPAKWHGPLLAGGGVLLIAAWVASFSGAIDPTRVDSSIAQRIFTWRAGCEALAGPQLVTGYGPAACLAVLPLQPSHNGFWLSQEAWNHHVHNEPLMVLLDGGLVLAGLLCWALFLTIRPLWRRRGEPACAALLVGWITAACGMLFDVHLSEPGGLLLPALLASATWVLAPGERAPQLAIPAWLPATPALAMLVCALSELLGDGGAAASVHHRALARMERLDDAGRLEELERMRRRIGPLDTIDYGRALLLGRLGRQEESTAALILQLRKLPCDCAALALAAKVRRAGRATPELIAAEAAARSEAAHWLAAVPHTGSNEVRIDGLKKVLAADGPDPAR